MGTHHASLKWLLNYKDADGMLARWLAKLQAYDFTIEHRPGLQHGNADGPFSLYEVQEFRMHGSF